VALPPSPVESSSHRHFYKLSRSWLLGGCHHSCLLWPAYLFTIPWGIAPYPLFSAQGALPSLLHVFFVVVYSVFFLFFPWVGLVCPGGYADLAQGCLWEYHMPLSSPCGLHLPKQSGSWHLVVWEPSWFLRLIWSEDAMGGLGLWRSQSFASSWWFFPVRCISRVSPRFYFRKHAFCFLHLVAILESNNFLLLNHWFFVFLLLTPYLWFP
jgi:hypothetical protein